MFLAFKKWITARISHAAGFSIVCEWCLRLPKEPTNAAQMCTIMTAALQRQYLQMELILWIRLIATVVVS
jgi:hypothetical protein